jgi:hypothetical protein
MKRGFLTSGKAQGKQPAAAASRPKKTPEELERERDAVIMSRLTIDQAIEYEALREDLATEKQTVRCAFLASLRRCSVLIMIDRVRVVHS